MTDASEYGIMESIAYRCVDDEFGISVIRSRGFVDYYKVAAGKCIYERAGRIHRERGAAYYQHIGIPDVSFGAFKYGAVERLAIHDYIRSYQMPARGALRIRPRIQYEISREAFSAADAVVARRRTV